MKPHADIFQLNILFDDDDDDDDDDDVIIIIKLLTLQ